MIRRSRDAGTPAMLLGPCAALSDRTGLAVEACRVLAVVLLCLAFKPMVALYCIAALALRLAR